MTEWLIDTLVATTLLMALVLLVREPVRRRFGAGCAYALWLIPAARLAMPTLTTTVERAAAPEAVLFTAAPSLAAMPAGTPPPPSVMDTPTDWTAILLAVWLAGAAVMLLRAAMVYRRQRRGVLAEAVQLAHLDGIRIVRSAAVGGPLAFGLFDRVIALPIDFDERFSAAQRRLALDHELSHHRSGDLFANHLAYGLLSLMWFNPLAWAAHAAFRFDQEAACDARVLDRAGTAERALYGEAIAKAASGRALLFAGALDRPKTLTRRLEAMTNLSTNGRRRSGQYLVGAAVLLALPLTASWATRYVEVAAPVAPAAATPGIAAVAPIAPVAASGPIAATAPVAPRADKEVRMHFDGDEKRWEDLSPEERAEVRQSLAQARAELAKVDMDEVRRDVREALAEAKIDRVEMQRELAQARIEVEAAVREIDANSAELRRAGQDPEMIKAQVRASLNAVNGMDIAAITTRALAAVDEQTIAASLRSAEDGLRHAEAELARAERKARR